MEKILLVPFSSVEADVQSSIVHALERAFRCTVEQGMGIPTPMEAYNISRGQFLASAILTRLRQWRSDRVLRVLGVIDVDIYVPNLNFVFGLADSAGGVAVISLARLRPEFYGHRPRKGVLLLRAGKEAVHEIGHTMGLGHCRNPRCVMFFSNSLVDTDRKEPDFCATCRNRLSIL